jgi:HEAT repeat protein
MSPTADDHSRRDSVETNPQLCAVDRKNQGEFWPPLSPRSFSLPEQDSCRDKLRAQLGLPSSLTMGTDEEEILFANLLNSSWAMRTRSIRIIAGLWKQKPDRVKRALTSALQDTSEYVRAAAAEGLVSFRDRTLVESLLRAIADPCWQVRAAAVLTLGKWGLRETIENLQQALADEEPVVQMAALHALHENGILKLRPDLVDALDSEDARVRLTAVQLLGKVEDSLTFEELRTMVLDVDEEVRCEALSVLSQLGEVIPMKLLLNIFNDRQEKVRVRLKALHLLREHQELLPLESLLRALKDANPQIQMEVDKLLGKHDSEIPQQVSSAFLLQLLQDDSEDLRALAAWALGEKRDLGAREALLRARNDSSSLVCTAASHALELLDSRPVDTEGRLVSLPTSFLLEQVVDKEGKDWQNTGVHFLTTLRNYLQERYAEVQREVLQATFGQVLLFSCYSHSHKGRLPDRVFCTLAESTHLECINTASISQENIIHFVAAQEWKYLEGVMWNELFLISLAFPLDMQEQKSVNISTKRVLCSVGLLPGVGQTGQKPVLKEIFSTFQQETLYKYSYQVYLQRNFTEKATGPLLNSCGLASQSQILVKPDRSWLSQVWKSFRAWCSSLSRGHFWCF